MRNTRTKRCLTDQRSLFLNRRGNTRREERMPKESQGLWTAHCRQVLARLLLLVLGCMGAISALDTLPAGATAVLISTHGHLAKPKPGTTLFTYRGHTSRVNGVAWSPNGKRIASAGGPQIWNAATGKLIYSYSGHS